MTVGTALRSGLRVLTARPASVLPVYLLVVGLTAMTRVPVLLALAAVIGLLASDGRLGALFTELDALDVEALDDSSPEAAVESIPPGLEQAVIDLVSPEIVFFLGGAVLASLLVSILANGLSSAAALNGIYGCLYGEDGVRDAVAGVGRDWKLFVGITLAQLAVLVVGVLPLALGASLFVISTPAGIAATFVGFLLSAGLIILGLLLLAFAGQSIVVDGAGFGRAIRRSAGFPFRRPVPFVTFVLVVFGVFGGLAVLGGVFSALGVSQLSGILGPLVAVPFLDAFKTALYADRPFGAPAAVDHQPTEADPVTDGGNRSTDDDDRSTDDDDRSTDDDDRSTDDDDRSTDDGDQLSPTVNQAATDTDTGTDSDTDTGDHSSVDADRATDRDSHSVPGGSTDADRPAARHRLVGAFRDGLAELAGFTRHHPVPILAAALLFGLSAVGGWQLTAQYAVDLPPTDDVGAIFGTFPVAAFVMIAANNWLVSATAIYGGVALGVPTAVDMLLNGFIVGAVYGVADPLVFAALVAPHGVIELPAIIIAGGLGFHVAATVAGVFRGARTATELADVLRLAYRVLLGLAVVLVIASFVEAFLTPAIAELVLA